MSSPPSAQAAVNLMAPEPVQVARSASMVLQDRLWLTVPEAGVLIGLGRSASYAAAERGDLPTRRLGRRIIVPVPLLCRWLGVDVTVNLHDHLQTELEEAG